MHLESIALSFVSGLSCRAMRLLLDIYGSPKDIYQLPAKELREAMPRNKAIAQAIINKSTFARAEQELLFCEKHHITPLFCTDKAYPQRLNLPGSEDTPPLLYSMGNTNLNAKKVVAVVGTRRATEYGKEMTEKLIADFQGQDILVVSGLAYGIDTMAHTASLSNHLPTVGVVAHGFDQLYPPQNRNLAKQMLQDGGGLITEYPSYTKIHPSYFPARNRIIAALSDAVVVVEAGVKGGALITANLANGYHREVFAFPGRVGDKYSEGSNRIISTNKAALIQSGNDLFELMCWEKKEPSEKSQQTKMLLDLSADETIIYNLLSQHETLAIEETITLCELGMPRIAAAFLNLELKDVCRCLPGKRYKLR